MATSEGVSAMISDLANEYQRSKNFLADLYRSLEERGVLKQPGTREDSCLAANELDGPASSIQDTTISNQFPTFQLSEEDSELSVCSNYSESSIHVPDLYLEPHHSPSSTHFSVNSASSHNVNDHKREDAQPLAAPSSLARTGNSARAGKKLPVVFSSCPYMALPAQDDTFDHSAALYVGTLESTVSQRRTSTFGPMPSLDNSAITHTLLRTPQPPVYTARHRRSSLDFTPAPPSFHRKRVDNGALTSAPSLCAPPSSLLPNGQSETQVQQGSLRVNHIMKRGSLGVYGCAATTAAGALAASPPPPPTIRIHSGSGVAPAAAPGARPVSGVHVRGGPLGRRSSWVVPIQPIPIQPQQPQEKQDKVQPQQQQQQVEVTSSHPVSNILRTTSATREVLDGGAGQSSPMASPLGSGFSYLPSLAPASGIALLPSLTSPRLKSAATATAGLLNADGSAAEYSSSAIFIPTTSLRRGGSNSVAAAAAATASLTRPEYPQPSSPGDLRSPSGRFSRCALGSHVASSSTPCMSSSPMSGTANAFSTADNASSAVLSPGDAGGRMECKVWSMSAGEVPDRLTPRLTHVPILTCNGGNCGDGSSWSARCPWGSPLERHDSRQRGICGGLSEVAAAALQGDASSPGSDSAGGAAAIDAPIAVLAAGSPTVSPVPHWNSPHCHHQPHVPHHPLLQHMQLHLQTQMHPPPPQPVVSNSQVKPESRTRLVPVGPQR